MSVLLALLSSVMWGSADFYGGLVSKRPSVYAVVGGSQAAGLAAVTVAAIATDAFEGPTDWIAWSILAGLSGVIGLLMFYTALARGTMGVVSPIAALGAVVPVVFGFARGDDPSPLAIVGIAVGLLGAFLASGPELRTSGSGVPIVLAALAGLCFGTCFVFIALGAESSAIMTMFGMRATSVLGFVLAAVALRSLGGLNTSNAPGLIVIGLADAGANLLYALASQRGYISVTSVVGSLYPVTTVLLAYVVLHERLQRIQVAGVIAALVGVALVSFG